MAVANDTRFGPSAMYDSLKVSDVRSRKLVQRNKCRGCETGPS